MESQQTKQDYNAIEKLGYDEATEQLKAQGCFSSGRTWDDDDQANEAYDRGVNRAEAQPDTARHSPLPWQMINGGAFDANASIVIPAASKREEANARLIVRAVNNAEKLERACNANAAAYDAKYDECEAIRKHAEKLAEALRILNGCAERGLDQSATHDGLSNCKAIADARQALADYERSAQ